MNAPDRFEAVVVPEGVLKIETIPDTKLPNTCTFKIEREDHTLGCLLRNHLLAKDSVIYAGYKVPHPLEYHVLLKVQTKPGLDPKAVLVESLNELIAIFEEAKTNFLTSAMKAKTERFQ